MKKPKKTPVLLDSAAGADRWSHDEASDAAGLAESPTAPPAERERFAWSKKGFAFASGSSYPDRGK